MQGGAGVEGSDEVTFKMKQVRKRVTGIDYDLLAIRSCIYPY